MNYYLLKDSTRAILLKGNNEKLKKLTIIITRGIKYTNRMAVLISMMIKCVNISKITHLVQF